MDSLAVRDLERRWGLTLLSFLPSAIHGSVRSVQDKLLSLAYPNHEHIERRGEPTIELYSGHQLHCTHLTLKRSSAWGPVRKTDLVKPGRDLFDLYETILEIASTTSPMDVELTRVKVFGQDNSILLLGQCTSESATVREALLSGLNSRLPESLDLSTKQWNTDPAKYMQLHCRLGFVKRPLLQAEEFSNGVNSIDLPTLTCTFDHIALVHHRYRSLAAPQEGLVTFRLGTKVQKPLNRDEFVSAICLQ